MTDEQLAALCFGALLVFACAAGVVTWGRIGRLQRENAALHESERRYRQITEHAGDLVALLDREGRWLYASPSYARIFRAADLAIGVDAFRNLHEEDQFRVRGALQVVVRSGEPCRLRMRLHTLSGQVQRFEAMVHPVREAEAQPHVESYGERRGEESAETRGEIVGAVFASRDITEQREREEQLEVAANAFEHMSEAMMITNGAGRILTVNRSYTRITGYAPAEVLGRQESEFRSALHPASYYDDIYAAVLHDGHWEGTTWCLRRNGSMYREWRSVSAVRDADQWVTHYVALFRELGANGGGQLPQEMPAKSA